LSTPAGSTFSDESKLPVATLCAASVGAPINRPSSRFRKGAKVSADLCYKTTLTLAPKTVSKKKRKNEKERKIAKKKGN